MAEINLSKYGITGTTEIVHNPSYEELFKESTVFKFIRLPGLNKMPDNFDIEGAVIAACFGTKKE